VGGPVPEVLRGGIGTPQEGDAVRIVPAITAEQVRVARRLFEAYAASLDFDLCFQDFETELRELPGCYAPPAGRLLLAEREGLVVGCVALRPLDAGVCEMKRLYLEPTERGSGLGRRLAAAIIDEARSIGYRRMRLDTVPSMAAAIDLYRRLGFREIPAYRANPVPGTLYLELEL
jgi:putative acetyltransferase